MAGKTQFWRLLLEDVILQNCQKRNKVFFCSLMGFACFLILQVHTGSVRPLGIKAAVEGKLHLRVANIGHLMEGTNRKIGQYYLYIWIFHVIFHAGLGGGAWLKK